MSTQITPMNLCAGNVEKLWKSNQGKKIGFSSPTKNCPSIIYIYFLNNRYVFNHTLKEHTCRI